MPGNTADKNSFLFVLDSNVTLKEHDIHLNDEILIVLQWILLSVVCQVIAAFGIGSNIVNVICFTKQGFGDPVNMSLLGLAISDLGCLTTVTWTNICLTPAVITADLPFDSIEFQYLTSAMPHAAFTRITSWITALVTVERCLCITAPLKIKSIITPKRVSTIIVSVFIILISSTAPVYVVNELGLKFFPTKNKTLLGLIYKEGRTKVEKVSFAINNIIIPFTAFLTIIVCTSILVVKLHNTTKWRNKFTASAQADNVSGRNQKVSKMIVMISTLFIACFVPLTVFFVAMCVEPELSITGRYRNIVTGIAMLVILLESINSSANIFIYYHMSSKYRIVFLRIFSVSLNKK